MADDTELPAASGGDKIRTISNTTSTQDGDTGIITSVEVKTQAMLVLTGPNRDGGASPDVVSEQNPFHIADANVRRLLEDIVELLERQTKILERLV